MAAKQEVKKMVLGEFAVNCYILTVDNANIIIDAGAEPELIEKYLNDEKIIPDFLLNTHGHYDHIGAVTEI
ncbi:MAG: MBL fold metallo-hydrolase [Actinobacteria bacterium]|nr:MBL fold metallo-hydrolase [Actinomycetota bacterium]